MTQILCYEELEIIFSEALNCRVKFIPEILLDKEKSIMKYEAYILETVHKPLSKTGIKNKMKELTELLQSCGIEAVINEPYYNDMHCIINRNDIENIKILLKLKGRMIS
jgi:hypothetical protein